MSKEFEDLKTLVMQLQQRVELLEKKESSTKGRIYKM